MKTTLIAAALAATQSLLFCGPVQAAGPDPTNGRSFCSGTNTPLCRFLNAPVQLAEEVINLEGRAYAFRTTRDALEFIDATGHRWRAPAGTLTDGASIPTSLAMIVGRPNSEEFINAAALHDASCGVGNVDLPEFHAMSWEETHRMFYDALRVGGTDQLRAKMMFAAVYLGGPRWEPGDRTFDSRQLWSDVPRLPTRGLGGTRLLNQKSRGLSDRALGAVPKAEMLSIMNRAKAYIALNDPSIAEIEQMITDAERAALERYATIKGPVDGQVAPKP